MNPKPSKMWFAYCETARGIISEFGETHALDFLVGQKLAFYFEASRTDAEFKRELPAFINEINSIFEPSQLVRYFGLVSQTRMMAADDPDIYEADTAEIPILQNTPEPDFIERAKVWLLRN